jgi:glycosyltransferase involved in cell wall biosynthesis
MPEKKRMKIAFVCDVIYPYVKGGVEKRVWELAVRLAARGHDVHIFGMQYWDGDRILVKEGVILHGICPARPLYANGRRTVGEALVFGLRLLPALVPYRFDIIDCQQFPFFSCFSAKALTMLRRTPLVITWHEVWGDEWYTYLGGGAGFFGKSVEWLVARLTSHVITVSPTTARRFITIGGTLATPIIPNGVDIRRIAAAPAAPDPSDIIFAGRLIREKHVDLLVEAYAVLSVAHPSLRLQIIGEGPESDAVRELIRKKGFGNLVDIRDFVKEHDDLIAYMKASKVCVLPSTREGFGITALEALACGLPVVTADRPANAIRDLITEETGFLCDLTADSLAQAISGALGRYGAMKEHCIAAASGYDWDCIAAECEVNYRSVINKRGPGVVGDGQTS